LKIFKGQSADERLLLHQNQFVFILIKKLIKYLIQAFILAFAVVGFLAVLDIVNYNHYAVIIGAVFFIVWTLNLVILYLKTYFIVTDSRIIISEQLNLFKNVTKSVNLNKLIDVATESSGKMFSFFGVGKIIIKTNSDLKQNRKLSFENLSDVQDVKLFLDNIEDLIRRNTDKNSLPSFIDLMSKSPKEIEISEQTQEKGPEIKEEVKPEEDENKQL